MSAISYFCKEEQNIKLSFPNPKPKIVAQEHHKLNYLLITLMSREVSDTLYEFAKLKIVTYEGLKNFDYLVNGDNDFLFTNKRHKGAIKQLSQDFQTTVDFFNNLANKCLSSFQIEMQPILTEILAIIFGIQYIQSAVPDLCSLEYKIPDAKQHKFLTQKIEELKVSFLKYYAEVSNAKTFDFDCYQKLFAEIRTMTYKAFRELTEKISQ